MHSRIRDIVENTSTPKRRRLGTGRIFRPHLQVFEKENIIERSPSSRPCTPGDRQDDAPLPCNQRGYLCESDDNSSVASDIPCSPNILECSVIKDIENWTSMNSNRSIRSISNKTSSTISRELCELDDLSDEMFHSRLEQESTQYNHESNTLSTTMCEKNFRESIEDSFDIVNKTISNLQTDKLDKSNKSSLFLTNDSFLLDIKESDLLVDSKNNQKSDNTYNDNHFYGLPQLAKGLFKSYRNIEKFYDWQEDCLNLDAIKERRNLIYALPTSGGKTLVAEVLMLREVLNRKKNALFILPYVAIVQEKMWSLSPFAVQLDFLIEEYAGGKGLIPPKKRRKKYSIYIATIEKGLALIRSLVELDRLDELGLIVVDELHLIGEPGRGATLEILLTTVLFAKKDIQIVGMSATIGNLPDLAAFLNAEIFTREFRPVELHEYVKLGDTLHRLQWNNGDLDVVPHRQLNFDYSEAGARLDPDGLGGLVGEVVPAGACLVFCPTQRNCENVAALLCKLQRREMAIHRTSEREALSRALRAEGASADLCRCARAGVAYHHAGLASEERAMLEHAYRAGIISALCCTSTLAAGVNLPARRVLLRAPRVAWRPLTLAAYRQMVGRAGRAGVCDTGESIIICSASEWPQLRTVLAGALPPARSVLAAGPDGGPAGLSPLGAGGPTGLLLSAAALGLANTEARLAELMECTLLGTEVRAGRSDINMRELTEESLHALVQCGAANAAGGRVTVSCFGVAAIKGCMSLPAAARLAADLEAAGRGLALCGALHLLYVVTPHDASGHRPDYRHYYSLYCSLDEEAVHTAKVLGITEVNAIRMMTGKPITNVPEIVLRRFYLAMMLHDLWNQMPLPAVAEKYLVSRGTVQTVMSSSASFASSAHRVCAALPQRWAWAALLEPLAARLQHCASPSLLRLLQLPSVHKARANQLLKAGYQGVEDIAKASPDDLVAAISHLSRKAANHLISSARMMLIEKVENLRAEAEEVMEDLNVP